MLHPDVVVLVPGFFGFRIFGEFAYFDPGAGRIVQAELCRRLGRPVSVAPVTTVPTGPLRERIEYLAGQLNDLTGAGAQRFYLVGHSTGGVDAQLFMTRHPFWGAPWPRRYQALQERVQSVVTISAPHYGTCLLDSTAVQFVAHPTRAPQGLLPMSLAGLAIPELVARDAKLFASALSLAPLQIPDLLTFLASVAEHHELLDELSAANMASIRAIVEPLDTPVTCYVTGADVQTTGRRSDRVYERLNTFCRTLTAPPVPEVAEALGELRKAPESLWIRSLPHTFEVDVGTNDGIVNTARQWLPGTTLGGIVVADHCDVIGDYDRIDAESRKRANTGLFHSGAGFGDGQFSELWRAVAASLVGAHTGRQSPPGNDDAPTPLSDAA